MMNRYLFATLLLAFVAVVTALTATCIYVMYTEPVLRWIAAGFVGCVVAIIVLAHLIPDSWRDMGGSPNDY